MNNFTNSLQNDPTDFGIQRKLFNANESDFFFINTAYFDAYLQLLEGIRQRHGLLLLTSEAGIGKTLLLRKLANEAPAKIKFVFCYSTNLDFENLITVISDQLGILTHDQKFSDKINALREYLNTCATQGIDVALLIDDAHHLREDVLSKLLEFFCSEIREKNILQIVLSGTPALEDILARMQGFHADLSNSIRIRLQPMTVADVEAFISRQMQGAGSLAVESLFPPMVIERIANYTGGIPRLVNTLCERALLIMRLNGQATVSMAVIDEAANELMLQDRGATMDSSETPDSVEATRLGSTVQIVRAVQSHPQIDKPSTEQPKSLLASSLVMNQPRGNSSAVARWDNLQAERKHSNLFRATGPQIVWLGLLMLLAGLLGGIASFYLQPFIPAKPAITGIESPGRGPASVQSAVKTESASVGITTPVVPEVATSLPKAPLESVPAPTPVTEAVQPAAQSGLPSTSLPISAARLSEASISAYISNGDSLLTRGDIASARLFYEAAANAGAVAAITAVGKTYDPVVLGGLGVKGFPADPVKAAEWYLKGEKAGDPENTKQLDKLRRWLSESPPIGEAEAEKLWQLLRR